MILNEHIDDFFKQEEIPNINRAVTSQDRYNSLDDVIENPYNYNYSKILDFSIKDDSNEENSAKISGILDYTNSQFVIKKLNIKAGHNVKEIVGKLLNSIVVNLETEQPDISVVYWRINKENDDCIYAALNYGFTVQDSNNFSMELTYYLTSTPFRQSNNSRQVFALQKKIRDNSSQRNV